MIEPFKGELMLHPCALDYNARQCSNRCAYCFANGRNSERQGNPKAFFDLVYGHARAGGLTRRLFDAGYAVCMSNRTDPLAASNLVDTRAAFRIANDMPNGLMIQTKGGSARECETLDIIEKKNVCVYISITARRPEILKRVEPGAADYNTRYAMARYALERGWAVIIGLNPLWRPWMGLEELDETVREFADAGAVDFLVQPLHLSNALLASMPAQNRARLTDEEIEGAGRPVKESPNRAYIREAFALLRRLEKAIGIHWMPTFFRPAASHMLDNAQRIMGKTMRSTQAFVDRALASKRRFFTAGDFVDALCAGGNEDLRHIEARNMNGYLFCLNRGAWRESAKAKSALTFEDVYREIFNNKRFGPSPQNLCGRFTPVSAEDDGAPLLDKSGGVILCKTERDWKAWEKKTIGLGFLKGKEVDTDEIEQLR